VPSFADREIVADAVEASGPSTEERQTIAEQPTEMFDVEQELGGPPSPTDEELVEEEIAEPRLAPTDPLAGLAETEEAEVSVQGPAPDDDDEYDDEDDAFWNEQRLSDELDQALEAPRDAEPEPAAEVEVETEPEPEIEERPSPTRSSSPRNMRRRPRQPKSRLRSPNQSPLLPHHEETCSRRHGLPRETPEDDHSGSSRSRPRTLTSTTERPLSPSTSLRPA